MAAAAEAGSIEEELLCRLSSIERVTLLRAGTLPTPETERLSEFCGNLDAGA